MNCPSCGAPMRMKPDLSSFKCDYCQSTYFPEKNDDGVRVLGEAPDSVCPVCSVPLMMGELAKVCILYCAKCGGMMIPMGIFPDLIEALRGTTDGAPESAIIQPQADSEDLQRKIDCPGCHRRMETHRYGGPGNVIIDSCETCSRIWLDRGELMRIVHAPDHRVESTAALDSVRCENSHVTPDYLDMLFG